jgi:acyl transferase domain-containing protein
VLLPPRSFVALSRLGALSPDGRCKLFSSAADGFGRAEGCVVVVLKRLSDARRDGDPILALIRESAINHDARAAVSRYRAARRNRPSFGTRSTKLAWQLLM